MELQKDKGGNETGTSSHVTLPVEKSKVTKKSITSATSNTLKARPSTSSGSRAAVTSSKVRPASAKASIISVSSSKREDEAALSALSTVAGASGIAIPKTGETFAAAQIRQLEEEVSHLRETIDVLLEARGGPKVASASSASSASIGVMSPRRSAVVTSDKAARVRSNINKHEETSKMVADTLGDKKKRDQKIVALEKESNRLRDPNTLAAALKPSYKRMDESKLHLKMVSPKKTSIGVSTSGAISSPVSAPGSADEAASDAIMETADAAVNADAAEEAAALASTSITAITKKASSSKNTSTKKTRPGSARALSSSSNRQVETKDSEDDVLAATTRSVKKNKSSHSGNEENDEINTNTHRKRPSTASARLRSTGNQTSSNIKETVKEFSFVKTLSQERALGIRESKFMAELEKKALAEEDMLKYVMKPTEIPASTRDPDLFKVINEKTEARRHALHEARAQKLASSFKPFSLVIQHCDELAARQAARKARFELQLDKELAEGRKFRAVPIPSTMTNPDGMFFRLIKREQERPERIKSMARAFFAEAALPPRMQLSIENQKRRDAERSARLKAEEEEDKRKHAFRRNSLPDLDGIYQKFASSLLQARTAAGVKLPEPFSFDQPERIKADLARKEKWVREYNLLTSTSMTLRKESKAYAEGIDVVGEGGGEKQIEAARTMRRMSAGDALGSTSRSQSEPAKKKQSIAEIMAKSTAPPAAMTRSVQLRVIDLQKRQMAQQEEARNRALADEESRRFFKEATAKFAPLIQEKEKERLSNFKPLIWEADPIAVRHSSAALESKKRDREFAKTMKALTARAGCDRTPLFIDAGVSEKAKEAAAIAALQTVDGIMKKNGMSSKDILNDDEIELLSATARVH
jgi:hypothetical protein